MRSLGFTQDDLALPDKTTDLHICLSSLLCFGVEGTTGPQDWRNHYDAHGRIWIYADIRVQPLCDGGSLEGRNCV